jgi:hypothetical protein
LPRRDAGPDTGFPRAFPRPLVPILQRGCFPHSNPNRPDLSRAFVNEDAGGTVPRRNYALPPRDDPAFDAAAAAALLEAARAGETASAEDATGYYWGEHRLHEHVRRIRDRAEAANDDRLVQLADRFLR